MDGNKLFSGPICIRYMYKQESQNNSFNIVIMEDLFLDFLSEDLLELAMW